MLLIILLDTYVEEFSNVQEEQQLDSCAKSVSDSTYYMRQLMIVRACHHVLYFIKICSLGGDAAIALLAWTIVSRRLFECIRSIPCLIIISRVRMTRIAMQMFRAICSGAAARSTLISASANSLAYDEFALLLGHNMLSVFWKKLISSF